MLSFCNVLIHSTFSFAVLVSPLFQRSDFLKLQEATQAADRLQQQPLY